MKWYPLSKGLQIWLILLQSRISSTRNEAIGLAAGPIGQAYDPLSAPERLVSAMRKTKSSFEFFNLGVNRS